MDTVNKTPVVIIHEPNWASPKLPAKHRFVYQTDVPAEKETITLTVSVMKRNFISRLLFGHDKLIGKESRSFPRTDSTQDVASLLEMNLISTHFFKV